MKTQNYKENNMHFKFVDLRIDNDFKQKDIAEKLDVKRSRYSMWEIGKRDYLFGLSNSKHKIKKENINYDLLAKRLKELRKERNLSQEGLGKEIGLSQRACSHYERKDNIPTSLILLYFAQYFNVSMDYLTGRSDVKEIQK